MTIRIPFSNKPNSNKQHFVEGCHNLSDYQLGYLEGITKRPNFAMFLIAGHGGEEGQIVDPQTDGTVTVAWHTTGNRIMVANITKTSAIETSFETLDCKPIPEDHIAWSLRSGPSI